MNIPFMIWVGVFLALIQLVLTQALLSRLGKWRPEVFRRMGQPHLLWNNTPRATLLFWRWLTSTEATKLDRSTTTLVWAIRLLTVLFLVWFVGQIWNLG